MTPTYCLAGGGNLKPSWELLFQAGDLTPATDTRLTDLQESKIKIKGFFPRSFGWHNSSLSACQVGGLGLVAVSVLLLRDWELGI